MAMEFGGSCSIREESKGHTSMCKDAVSFGTLVVDLSKISGTVV